MFDFVDAIKPRKLVQELGLFFTHELMLWNGCHIAGQVWGELLYLRTWCNHLVHLGKATNAFLVGLDTKNPEVQITPLNFLAFNLL